MRIYPQLLVDQEFKSLGDQGFMGTLNDRQFAFLRSKGYVNALPDMMTSWLSYSPANLFALNEPGIWLDPSDVANLDWRRNLLTYTEQFQNAVWTLDNSGATNPVVTANFGAAPDGSITADRIQLNKTGGLFSRIQQSMSFLPSAVYTFSVWLRNNATGTANVGIRVDGSAVNCAVTETWQRFSVTLNPAGTTATSQILLFDSIVGNDETADILAWGAQLELGSVTTDYQRISDVNTEVLERFPRTTMFQDRAGSTAVTTPGQSVGLRLDKSKGLVLGSELVTNGTFDSGTTGWTAFNSESSISESGGELFTSHIGGVASPALGAAQVLSLVVGKAYKVTAMVRRQAGADSVNLAVTNNARSAFVQQGPAITNTTATMAEIVFVATETNNVLYLRAARAVSAVGWSGGVFDNISVKELPGFHAVANSDAARGIYGIEPLGGRRNLLTFTEQFDNAAWAKTAATVTANAGVAPDGTTTADKIVENTSASAHLVAQSTAALLATPYVASVYAKAGERSFVSIGFDGLNAWFNLSTGAVGTVESGLTATITSAGNGWYHCAVYRTIAVAAAKTFAVYVATANNVVSYTGDGTSGIFIWGAQVELGSTATAYQRVTTQYDVTEAGKQTLHYVQYDGSDDGYVTPTITPGTDKVQVFAGVRKLSDAATGMVIEHSPNVNSNNGAFWLGAPITAGTAQYQFNSKGTTASAASYTNAAVAAPVTSVLTGLGDISGDLVSLRANGSLVAQSANDQGAGNYLAYPMYIGRRGGTLIPFNGRDYGIITRFGANLDASTIAATESWLNQKTGAY